MAVVVMSSRRGSTVTLALSLPFHTPSLAFARREWNTVWCSLPVDGAYPRSVLGNRCNFSTPAQSTVDLLASQWNVTLHNKTKWAMLLLLRQSGERRAKLGIEKGKMQRQNAKVTEKFWCLINKRWVCECVCVSGRTNVHIHTHERKRQMTLALHSPWSSEMYCSGGGGGGLEGSKKI